MSYSVGYNFARSSIHICGNAHTGGEILSESWVNVMWGDIHLRINNHGSSK